MHLSVCLVVYNKPRHPRHLLLLYMLLLYLLLYICMCHIQTSAILKSRLYSPDTALILLLMLTTHTAIHLCVLILIYIYVSSHFAHLNTHIYYSYLRLKLQSRLYSPDTALDLHMRDMESNGLRGPRGTPSPQSQVC